jgi:hypothetical protein
MSGSWRSALVADNDDAPAREPGRFRRAPPQGRPRPGVRDRTTADHHRVRRLPRRLAAVPDPAAQGRPAALPQEGQPPPRVGRGAPRVQGPPGPPARPARPPRRSRGEPGPAVSHAHGLIAVLDANVLYPQWLRDAMLTLAAMGYYEPRWSGHPRRDAPERPGRSSDQRPTAVRRDDHRRTSCGVP